MKTGDKVLCINDSLPEAGFWTAIPVKVGETYTVFDISCCGGVILSELLKKTPFDSGCFHCKSHINYFPYVPSRFIVVDPDELAQIEEEEYLVKIEKI